MDAQRLTHPVNVASTGRSERHSSPIVTIAPHPDISLLPEDFRRWFAARGWSPREHQLALLAKAREDRSALLIAPTGAGKTLAGFLPTLVELSRRGARDQETTHSVISTGRTVKRSGGLHTLYISPLKALAVDIARNLET